MHDKNTVKPAAELSGTDWLTTAVDAEAGDELVEVTADGLNRVTITHALSDQIALEDGRVLDPAEIDMSNQMVIE